MASETGGDTSFADVSLSTFHRSDEQATAPPPEPTDTTMDEKPSESASGELAVPYAIHKHFDHKKKTFYASNEGAFEKAVEDIKATVVTKELDGEEVIGAWLLTEVDHWDNETEKVVVVTTESMLTVRYDFVPSRVHKFKRQQLKDIDTVKAGEFQYPTHSLLNLTSEFIRRTCSGIRLMWNKGVEPGLLSKWNPSSSSMPWQTFSYHPLAFTEQGEGQQCYGIKNFTETVVKAIRDAHSRHSPGSAPTVVKEPLEQNIYVGFPSQIHNQSFLGMSKDRGFVSF